jgi:Receptor family ligand binding region
MGRFSHDWILDIFSQHDCFSLRLRSELSTWTLTGQARNLTNQGFSHMSAALLAVEHFNSRNATVVPELANLTSCNVRFDTNLSRVLDSSVATHLASESLLPLLQQEIVPCAMAGPFHDLPAEDLSVLALSAKIPLVAQRAYNVRVASDYFSPYSSQVYPTVAASTRKLVEYLQYKGRTNYIGFLFSLTIVGTQRLSTLTVAMDTLGMKLVTSSFVVDNSIGETYADQNVSVAMKKIKDAGYRAIVVSMEFRWGELQPIADAAEELGMNQGDYFWVWYDNFELTDELMKNSNVTKLVAGSAWLVPLSGAVLAPETDPFAMAWYSQGKEAVDRLNAFNPINPGEVGYVYADDDWFQTAKLEIGSGESEISNLASR